MNHNLQAVIDLARENGLVGFNVNASKHDFTVRDAQIVMAHITDSDKFLSLKWRRHKTDAPNTRSARVEGIGYLIKLCG